MAELTDRQIARLARARVSFRIHAATYVAINVFLFGVWFMTDRGGYYWPAWTHLGWGLGLAFHGFGAYGPGPSMMAREEEKIRRGLGKT